MKFAQPLLFRPPGPPHPGLLLSPAMFFEAPLSRPDPLAPSSNAENWGYKAGPRPGGRAKESNGEDWKPAAEIEIFGKKEFWCLLVFFF